MDLDDLLAEGQKTYNKLQNFKEKTGTRVELLKDLAPLPEKQSLAEEEIARRAVKQITSAPKEDQQKLLEEVFPTSTSQKQKFNLKTIFERIIEKIFAPIFNNIKDSSSNQWLESKKELSKFSEYIELMVSNAISSEKSLEYEGNFTGRVIDTFFPTEDSKKELAGIFQTFEEILNRDGEKLKAINSWAEKSLSKLLGENKSSKLLEQTKNFFKENKLGLSGVGLGAGLLAEAALPIALAIPTCLAAYMLPIAIGGYALFKKGIDWKNEQGFETTPHYNWSNSKKSKNKNAPSEMSI